MFSTPFTNKEVKSRNVYLFDKDSQSLQDDNHNGIGLQNNLERKFHCFDKESLSMVSVDEIKCCSNSN